MDYTSIYINMFIILIQAFKALLPYFLIVIAIILIKRKQQKKKTALKEYKQKQPINLDYEQSDYYKETHTSYEDMIIDKGKAGEYAAYRNICNISGYKKFLFNVYVEDSKNSAKKTEIDLLLIHETGLYVIECKNFKGWIYGDETSEKWCQVFKNGKKFLFYNPIKQNYKHIQYLRHIVGTDKEITSIITFGDDATLKKITNTNDNLKIINNRELKRTLENKIRYMETRLQPEQVDELYNKLKAKQW